MKLMRIHDTLVNLDQITMIDVNRNKTVGGVDIVIEGNGCRRKFIIDDVSVSETIDALSAETNCFNLPVNIRMRRNHRGKN